MDAKETATIFKDELQKEIARLLRVNHLEKDFFERHSIASPGYFLHSRMLGVIARIDLGNNWLIDIERAIKPDKIITKQFRPDATVWDSNGRLMLVIEYESINGSDYRIVWKDLGNYTKYVLNSTTKSLPTLWIIISTLKDGPVNDWDSWDWKQDGIFYEYSPAWQTRLRNKLLKSPLKFWKPYYLPEFERSFKETKEACPICWMNIDSDKVNIEFLIVK